MATFINPPKLSPRELKAHLKCYANQCSPGRHLWNVHTDMPVFKWAECTDSITPQIKCCIVNLTIPKGAVIRVSRDALSYPEASRKMRADRAVVHSLATLEGQPLQSAWSWFDMSTRYSPGKIIAPRRPFDTSNVDCASGIHFYAELRYALRGARS